MEGLLRFSKLKLQLLALIADNNHLRERELSAREELRLSVQRQRDAEVEFSGKVQELQAEVVLREELQRKLETRMKYLETDNILLEKKQKELKDTLDNLLKSRDSFMSVYEGSTCALKNAIELRDRKLNILSDKIKKHLSLLDSIEKEAEAVKQMVDGVQQLVSEKEQVVTRLKEKMDKLSTLEKEFVEKICSMESKLSDYQQELQRKDTTLLELKEQLEAAMDSIILQSQVEEFQKALQTKDEVIQSLASEKQGLHLELLSMEHMLRRVQDAVVGMCQERDQNAKTLPLQGLVVRMASGEENGRLGEMTQAVGDYPPSKTHEVIMLHQEGRSAAIDTSDRNISNSCTSELFVHSSPRSVCSVPPLTASIHGASIDEKKPSCALAMHHLDSESSTTEASASAVSP